MSIAEGREISKRFEARQEEIGPSANRGERGQAGDALFDPPFRNLELERAVLCPDDRIAFVPELVEVLVVDPHILRELELPDQTPADDERGDAALDPIVRGTLREWRAVRRAAANHPAAVHVGSRIARIHPAAMRAQRYRIAVRILVLVAEVVVALHVGTERWIVFLRRQHQRRATAPATHQLRGNQLLPLGSLSMLTQEVPKRAHVLLQAAIGQVAAVAREGFGLRQSYVTVLVRIAEDELPGLERRPGSRCGLAGSFDNGLRQPVPIPEVVVGIVERWSGLELEGRKHLHTRALREELLVFGHTPRALGRVSGEQDADRMQLVTRQPTDPGVG